MRKRYKVALFLFLVIFMPLTNVLTHSTPLASFNLSHILIQSRDSLPAQPFSLVALIFMAFLGLCPIVFFLLLFCKNRKSTKSQNSTKFPWWGWLSIGCLIGAWTIAWRTAGHQWSFSFLWLSYIVFINALTYARVQKSLLTNQFIYLFRLALVSIPFWWYFEYLNRFTLNWFYLVDKSFNSPQYLILGSISFMTVLPAVISTQDFLLSFPSITHMFHELPRNFRTRSKLIALITLVIGCSTLAFLGVWPQFLYPFLWISPLLILVSLQELWGDHHIFRPVSQGYWGGIVSAYLAALICGTIWELWNFYSIPKWVYSVPWVDCCHVFEMPLIGYVGYLPFGLECYAVAAVIKK